MKTCITKKQWNELNDFQKLEFAKTINLEPKAKTNDWHINFAENMTYLVKEYLPTLKDLIKFIAIRQRMFANGEKVFKSHFQLDNFKNMNEIEKAWYVVVYNLNLKTRIV